MYNSTELWQKETSLPSIPTFCQNLDNLLGNEGVQLGSLTEVLGLPGTGKTQLCLQLCAATQIPEVLGGLDAEALYIDTNTNFTICRYKEILKASIAKCQRLLDDPTILNEEDALKRLHYVNAFGLEQFCTFMHCLPKLIIEYPNIKLIVIDSITFPFKEGIEPRQRTGLLFRQMADLQRVANEKQIAVVMTNEMSTRVGLSSGAEVGALGDAWGARCGARLLLAGGRGRRALLLKGAHNAGQAARFQITLDGIRDVE
ncbi:DNA repair protein RAD51 homolog 3 [Plodia interpunctella]|uniref:DNA repair protein RAD51 homolog 3 n=1 Tax=Plodia interpunctella TaxID=58824 RepID=UPI002368E4B7|nr:DNA repair protein RAD51 homolog 3 [Plodia interpunctella]